ncbi:MAG: DUF924 domain-containing protein [Rhodospirillaceae bacterium]|nr:DUF924 domain-containing protein [Rhodospirillaceae bacterium]
MVTPADITRFWFETYGPADWFAGSGAFDAAIAEAFGDTVEAALGGGLGDWAETPLGALALVLALDQFPRNLFRDSARAFAGDARAREVADMAIDHGFDLSLSDTQRLFLYLPFEHSEAMTDQRRALSLISDLRANPQWIDHAALHLAVIHWFGRFPQRNAALGRETTEAEAQFLGAIGGFP